MINLSVRSKIAALLLKLPAIILAVFAVQSSTSAGTLSDPLVDAYNVHVGTETFSGLYKFTTNTLLIETAQAITNLGSDTIKCYLGPNTAGQSGVNLAPGITSLKMIVRDDPSYHAMLDMPFRHIIMWAYPLSTGGTAFQDGNYTSGEAAADYKEMYDLTTYLLTNYNNSGKTFYLGHWEGDGYLEVNGWTTNPSPSVVTAMIAWENNRQQAVDDAKAAAQHTNVNIFYYAEANRVRDAMFNGSNNNVRMINSVIPYVTNLDYISYSSYDAQNLSASDLYTTLNYMEAHFPTNKAGTIPGTRLWIGEYGWGYLSTDAQEPNNRAYIQRLLNWNYNGQTLPFILMWEMYNNEVGKNYSLIDSNDVKVASWYLHQYFINDAKMLVAQFKQTHGRLPTDLEFSSFVTSLLNQPLAAPVSLAVANLNATVSSNLTATISGTVAQGIYGDDEAGVWVYYGRQDGGTTRGAWEGNRFLGVNTNFNPATFTATLSNLVPQTNYFYRFYAINATNSAWSPTSAQFSTAVLNASDFGSSMKISFAGYNRSEVLSNFPVLVNLSTNLPHFSYRQFASPIGGDLRFTDAAGSLPIPYEIDEWNTNGVSGVWVNVPRLATTNDFIWAYWGNPAATNPPTSSTNGSVWPNFNLVWHLKENGFPFADSADQWPAAGGVAPTQTGGVIGHGESFNGTTTFLDAGTVNNLGNAFTLSAWVNVVSGASNIQTIWANQKGGFGSAGFSLFVNSYNTSNQRVLLDTGDGTNGLEVTNNVGAVTFGQWHLVSAAIDRVNGTVAFYVDGAATGGGGVTTDFVNNADLNLGRFTNSALYFKGTMDEARIQSGVQTSNSIWAGWMTVASNSALESYSTVTQKSPGLTLSNGTGNGFSLSWPGSGVGFALYSATNLTQPVAWAPVTNVPMWTNNQWQITLSRSNGTGRFYRLQSQ